jgi:disulfide bond formation protein DsbB
MLALVACGGTGDAPSYSAEMISNGESLFKQTCFACHGPEGKGIPNLGKDLTTSAFVKDSTDGELLAYVLEGRPADDPANTTGIAMPPKGGFDFLSNDDIEAIIAFVRSIDE